LLDDDPPFTELLLELLPKSVVALDDEPPLIELLLELLPPPFAIMLDEDSPFTSFTELLLGSLSPSLSEQEIVNVKASRRLAAAIRGVLAIRVK
jgi:hypothetical protein